MLEVLEDLTSRRLPDANFARGRPGYKCLAVVDKLDAKLMPGTRLFVEPIRPPKLCLLVGAQQVQVEPVDEVIDGDVTVVWADGRTPTMMNKLVRSYRQTRLH